MLKSRALIISALGAGGAVLSAGVVQGQEALAGAVRNDETLQVRAQAPEGKKFGPMIGSVAGTFEAEWNDNIRQREVDVLDDIILRPGVDLTLGWPVSERASLSLGVGIAYEKYLSHSEYDALEVSPDSAVAFNLTVGDVVITVYDRVSYSEEVVTQPELVDQARYPRLDNEAGLRATWTIQDWQLQGGYGHYNLWTTDDDFEYLDRSSEQFFMRGAYLVGPTTRVGVEGSASLTAYATGERSDFSSYSAGPFIEWTVIEGLRLIARGGAVRLDVEGSAAEPGDYTLDSYYTGGQVEHQLTEFVRHSVTASHDIRVGLNADFTEATALRYEIGWQMTDYWHVLAGARYELGNKPSQSGGVLDEEYDRYGADASLVYRMTDALTLRARYAFTQRESNVPGRNYDQNLVLFSLRYGF